MDQSRVSPVLRSVLSYYAGKKNKSWAIVKKPTRDDVHSACQSFYATLRDNNGIKQECIEKLFFPIGVREEQLGALWLANMDSFGRNRGLWAHNGERIRTPPDPPTERKAVMQLLEGVEALDQVVARLR